MNSTLKPCEADPIGMTFVLHSARVASLIVLCLLLTSEDAAVYYWEWEKGSVDAGRPLDSAGVILQARGQNSEVLFLLTFFFVAFGGLCASFSFWIESFVSLDLVGFL